MTEYKPYILLILFSIAILSLEMVLYHGEITAVTESQLGMGDLPNVPTTYWRIPLTEWRIPDVFAWILFFGAILVYMFAVLGVALTLPIEEIPLIVRIVILAPIWIMTTILAYNAMRAFIKAIGEIIPL